MNSVSKAISVRFFEVKADDKIRKKFAATFKSLLRLSSGADIVTTPNSRYILHFLKANDTSASGYKLLFWSSVKERNTWQVRSSPNGKISGLGDSNSIIGDVSYYKYDPDKALIAAFTTCPSSGYLKSMCKTIFTRLTSQSADFNIDYIFDDVATSQVRNWDYFSKMSIKLDTDKILDDDDKPDIIKALMGIKGAFGGGEISITLDGGKEHLPRQDVTETINYLSSSDSCSSLALSGGIQDSEEMFLPINLKKAFVKYRTRLKLKPNQSFIDSDDASKILTEAFSFTSSKLKKYLSK